MDRVIIRRDSPAIAQAILWGLMAALFATNLSVAQGGAARVTDYVFILASLLGALRAYRSNTIIADARGIEVRRFARTYRWPWPEVRSVQASAHVNGFRGQGTLIEVEARDCHLRLREFYWPEKDDSSPPRAQKYADQLNRARPFSPEVDHQAPLA